MQKDVEKRRAQRRKKIRRRRIRAAFIFFIAIVFPFLNAVSINIGKISFTASASTDNSFIPLSILRSPNSFTLTIKLLRYFIFSLRSVFSSGTPFLSQPLAA